MSEEHWDEPFLRSVAAVQAQMSLINAEADELTDLGDMQAQRKLKAELNEYVSAHSDSGIIPSNPLEVIGDRLKDITKLFSDAKLLLHELSETTKIVPYNELKSISLDGLKVELEQVKEMETALPARNENLKQQSNPLDWSESSPAHLYPELLVCASALGVELPEDKEERREIYEFSSCSGNSLEKAKEKLKAKEKDIHELIDTHELYRKTLAVIMECTKRGDHIKASEHLDTIKIPFADIPITECTLEVDKLKLTSKNIILFCKSASKKCDSLKQIVDAGWAAKAEFSDLQEQLGVYEVIVKSFSNSEIEKECKPLLKKVRSDFEKAEVVIANRIAKRNRKRKFKLIAISVVLVAFGLVIADQYKAYQLEEAKREKLAAIEEAKREKLAAIEIFFSAVKRSNIEAVKLGLEEGAYVNAKDKWGQTPLHHAANNELDRNGDRMQEIVELLIAAGADVNAETEYGATPLHFTAANGRKEVAELLIVKGAKVNAANDDGYTPLDLSVLFEVHETAELLRKHGAKTSAELKASQN
jgi:hypothetical protein